MVDDKKGKKEKHIISELYLKKIIKELVKVFSER